MTLEKGWLHRQLFAVRKEVAAMWEDKAKEEAWKDAWAWQQEEKEKAKAAAAAEQMWNWWKTPVTSQGTPKSKPPVQTSSKKCPFCGWTFKRHIMNDHYYCGNEECDFGYVIVAKALDLYGDPLDERTHDGTLFDWGYGQYDPDVPEEVALETPAGQLVQTVMASTHADAWTLGGNWEARLFRDSKRRDAQGRRVFVEEVVFEDPNADPQWDGSL